MHSECTVREKERTCVRVRVRVRVVRRKLTLATRPARVPSLMARDEAPATVLAATSENSCSVYVRVLGVECVSVWEKGAKEAGGGGERREGPTLKPTHTLHVSI